MNSKRMYPLLLIGICLISKGAAFAPTDRGLKQHHLQHGKDIALLNDKNARTSTTKLYGKRKRLFNLFSRRKRRPAKLTKELVRNLFYKWNNALATGDSTSVADMYTSDAILIATSSNERKMDYESIKSYFDPVVKRNPSVSIVDGNIKIGEDWAMDVGIYEWTFGDDGSKKQARYTFLYVPDSGGDDGEEWKICHHHSSALPE